MKRRHRLQNIVLLSFVVLASVMIIVISAVVGVRYVRKKMESTGRTAFSYTKSAAEYIDGDRIEEYLENGEKDNYYYEIMDFLNAFQEGSDIRYYYVFVPTKQDVVYIWDADMKTGACELGEHENYMEGGKSAVEKIYRKNPPEDIVITRDDTYGYIASAYSPLFNSEGIPVAVVGADIFMPDLEIDIFHFLAEVIVSVVIVVVAAVLLFFIFIEKQIVYPVKLLCHASKNMVNHLENEDVISVNIKTGNEIEELSEAFNQMYCEVKEYIRKYTAITAEKERISTELSVARKIQASMLPDMSLVFPERNKIDIYASMTPAKEVGGDFYDFFMVDYRHLAFVAADVSGKGVPAALFMVIGKTLIKDHTKPYKNLGEVFTEVNTKLCESNDNGMFITAFEGVLDLVTGELCYVNAGHEKPFIYRKNGSYELFEISPGFVLGGIPDMKFTEHKIRLNVGDKIFQYTDGVTEAADCDNRLYGIKRLLCILNQRCRDSSPQKTLEIIKEDIDIFVGKNEQSDDITMLCLEYKNKMEA